jgi:hypothetical protein
VLPVSTGLTLAALLVLGGTLWRAHERAELIAAPVPIEEPVEVATAPPAPVVGGSMLAEVVDVAVHGHRVFATGREEDAPIPFDEPAIDAFVTAVGLAVDALLTDAQRGTLPSAPDFVGPAVLDALTTPQRPVTSATYRIVVFARGGPEWASATIEVLASDGDTQRAVLVFAADDPPTLLAAELLEPQEVDAGTDTSGRDGT